MGRIAQLTTAVETVIHDTMDLPRTVQQRLVFFVLSVLLTGTIVLWRIAITHAFGS